MLRAFFILFLFIQFKVEAQESYLIYLKPQELSKVNLALSNDAIARKKKLHIPIDEKDYQIDPIRMQMLRFIQPSLQAVNWFNAVVVKNISAVDLSRIQNLSFVDQVRKISTAAIPKSKSAKLEANYTIEQYGAGYTQLKLHNADILHNAGYTGNGMKIAVFDAGFVGVDTIQSFQHLYTSNRIIAIKNLVHNNQKLYDYDGHGTAVLGCLASYVKDTFVGSAPDANYFLFLTEDASSETQLEEIYWAIAAQMADSIGIDIINSSLGYTEFDDPSTNYKNADMNGKTAISSKAAAIACTKGIVVVNSAGNLGNRNWKIISAPADVEDVITVGSVREDKTISDFSSRGWNSNNAIKPNIVGVGQNTALYYHKGRIARGSGTSFSSPLIAGLIACYWQQYPQLSPANLRTAIYSNSDRYDSPNKDYGFGLPDFGKSYSLPYQLQDTLKISIYPNPAPKTAIVEFISNSNNPESSLEIYGFQKLLMKQKLTVQKGKNTVFINLDELSSGTYFVNLKLDNYVIGGRFVKI